MTREEAKREIEQDDLLRAVKLHYADGGTVQAQRKADSWYDSWKDVENPNFSPSYHWRKKPEPRKPREWFLNLHSETGVICYLTEKQARDCACPNCKEVAVRVREVLADPETQALMEPVKSIKEP